MMKVCTYLSPMLMGRTIKEVRSHGYDDDINEIEFEDGSVLELRLRGKSFDWYIDATVTDEKGGADAG